MSSGKKLHKKHSLIGKIFEILLLALLLVAFILPFYYMIISSFKSLTEAMNKVHPVWWPEVFHWENYVEAWQKANFLVYAKNSIILSVTCTAACIFVSVPSAFAFARMEFKGKKILWALTLSSMMVPAQCVFLPVFIMYGKLNLTNTYGGMILLFTHSGSTIFFLRNAFKQISNEVLEAARLDGSSELTVMFKVTLPMAKPVILTMALMVFIRRWNDYFWNITMTTNDHVRTLPFAVKQIGMAVDGGVPNYAVQMAAATMLMAPMLIAYIFANKKIKNAFVYSGIK